MIPTDPITIALAVALVLLAAMLMIGPDTWDRWATRHDETQDPPVAPRSWPWEKR